MTLAIETEDLGKRYGRIRAVERLSLRVAEGEIYAFLGLNGAGKTTTLRMLLGMIRPSTGWAQVLGTQVRLGRREPWASVGYMVEVPHAYPELSVYETLEVARRLHPGTPAGAIRQALDRLGLAGLEDRRTGDLSQGNAQRLGLAKALLHAPRLLLLDEPANGLDPAGIVDIRELLLELTREQGVTVFMASHILAEVSRLAGRIGILHEGRLLQETSIGELEKNRKRRLVVRTRAVEAAQRALIAAGQAVEILPDGTILLTGASAVGAPEEISRLLVHAQAPPSQVMVEEEDLEQYFLRLVRAAGAAQNA